MIEDILFVGVLIALGIWTLWMAIDLRKDVKKLRELLDQLEDLAIHRWMERGKGPDDAA